MTLRAIPGGGRQVLTAPVSTGYESYAVWVDGASQVTEMDEANNLVFRRVVVPAADRRIYLPLVSR